ncbi:MAG: cytochrome c biogenesis protein ResB [Spirochaetales bacterium]|nr:cytochrome c biogenesis protein ResB [Spirochaetales bacterium]
MKKTLKCRKGGSPLLHSQPQEDFFSTVLGFFTSIKVAVVLLAVMTATYILSSLVPLGLPDSEYFKNYPALLAQIIVFLDFHHFYTSFWFIAPLILFFVNLTACSINRFSRHFTFPGKKRFGPDIIHLGLLCLIVAGGITCSGHSEKRIFLREGDVVTLPGNQSIHLNKFDYLTYDNGRDKDYTAFVTIQNLESSRIEKNQIKVNHPLMLKNVSVYLVNREAIARIVLAEPGGKQYFNYKEDRIPFKDGFLYFGGFLNPDSGNTESYTAHFEYWKDNKFLYSLDKKAGETVDLLTLLETSVVFIPQISIVADPVPIFIIFSFIIIGAGLALTYFQKLRDEK